MDRWSNIKMLLVVWG